ncbi:MAG: hypothetical protein ABIN80_02830 [Dyadobacter sp.]|uniref:hypothetical protein n=1 Tax=Dyadobacter sp. TaxID=1914288 RepID=UPI003267D2CC
MDKDQEEPEEEIVFLEAHAPTEKELFYLDWARDMIKNQFTLANDQLKHIISLCVALLSVSVIFEKLFESDPQAKFFTVLLFFIALVFACVGINPFSRNIWLNSPSEIEKFQKQAMHYKKVCYGLASVFLVFGIAMIVFSVARQAFGF